MWKMVNLTEQNSKQPHRGKGTLLAGKLWGEAEKPKDFSEVFCVMRDVKLLLHLFTLQ